jgi:hypothetical protein
MGLRFYGSLGAFRLLQWNVRELALTVRLGLSRVIHRFVLTKGLEAGRPHARPLRISLPADLEAGQCVQHFKAPPKVWAPQFDGRRIHSMATLVVAVVLGYVAGRAATWQQGPILAASAEVAVDPSPAPEGLAPLVWAFHTDAVHEASPPVAKVSTHKLTAPVSEPQQLNADEVREAQAWLNAFGFSSGPVDGLAGPQTMAAVKRYRLARKMEEMGGLDQPVLKQMRQQSGQ